jgi:uncharacterized membrane protein YfcA
MTQRFLRLWPFLLWLAAFYAVWLYLVHSEGRWPELLEHWGIAVAMALGSYVAGSTPMGGGTVGFPILVLLFDEPAQLGRDFGFAIQSIGMVSATVFILCRRQPLEWPMLRAAMAGSLLGTPLGILWVAPVVPGVAIKVLFAVVWASFGVLHFYRGREITAHHGIIPTNLRFDTVAGLAVGFLCGLTVASITGVGIDMVLYVVLVLVCHADLKIAIPTSVIVMAFTSVVGIVTKLLLGDVQPGVYVNWLVAAPIVALGAPLGAFIVHRIGRESTLMVVSVLCVAQFVWTMIHEWERLQAWGLAAALLGVLLFNLLFQELHRIGDRLERRQRDYPFRSGL